MSKINFDSIRKEKQVDELFRMKHEMVKLSSKLHEELHSGNSQRDKSEILGEINETRDLEEYVEERIKKQKNEDYIENKEKRNGLTEFKELCRERLSPDLFKEIENASRKR